MRRTGPYGEIEDAGKRGEVMHEEFARATMKEKFARYQAEAREPRIRRSVFRRPKAERAAKLGALRPTASG